MRPSPVTLYALVSLVLLTALLTRTDAHRSGCHRWHSCPSDHGKPVGSKNPNASPPKSL
jgi:hypothetical protein